MSKAADRSSKISSTEDLEAALASLRASVSESRAVSVEWPRPLSLKGHSEPAQN